MKPTDISAPDYFHKVVDCQWACPAHTPVPEYIRLIAQGTIEEAVLALHAEKRDLAERRQAFMEELRGILADIDRMGRVSTWQFRERETAARTSGREAS